jgi:hypothetical protein
MVISPTRPMLNTIKVMVGEHRQSLPVTQPISDTDGAIGHAVQYLVGRYKPYVEATFAFLRFYTTSHGKVSFFTASSTFSKNLCIS